MNCCVEIFGNDFFMTIQLVPKSLATFAAGKIIGDIVSLFLDLVNNQLDPNILKKVKLTKCCS